MTHKQPQRQDAIGWNVPGGLVERVSTKKKQGLNRSWPSP